MLPTIGRVRRLYIAGEKNVLADVLSRYGWDQHVANHLPVPDMPIRKIISLLFTAPADLADAVRKRSEAMGFGAWQPVSASQHSKAKEAFIEVDTFDPSPEVQPNVATPADASPAPANSGAPAAHAQSDSAGREAPAADLPATPQIDSGGETPKKLRYATRGSPLKRGGAGAADAPPHTSRQASEPWLAEVPATIIRPRVINEPASSEALAARVTIDPLPSVVEPASSAAPAATESKSNSVGDDAPASSTCGPMRRRDNLRSDLTGFWNRPDPDTSRTARAEARAARRDAMGDGTVSTVRARHLEADL